MRDGKVGTRSIPKYATTRARHSYCSRSETNIWVRWIEGKKRLLVDTYSDIFMSYVEAKVVAAIFKGSPVKYVLKGGIGMIDYWLLENAAPNIVKVCGE